MKTQIILFLGLLTCAVQAQTLVLSNEKQTQASLTNTTVTMTGHSELVLTGSGDPLPGCTIHLNDEDSWVFLEQAPPSQAAAYLTRFRVNGSVASQTTNVRLVQYINGSVIIPHSPSYQPLEIFDGQHLAGKSRKLDQYVAYNHTTLGSFNDRIRSFRLKRGYMATFAANPDGTVASQCYIAQDSDLEVSVLPGGLDNAISFIRVFPWRWVSKKGSCDYDPNGLDADWHYNWNISWNSSSDWEYVAIKQQPYWPGTNQDWKARGVTHLSGFNEPDNPVEDAYKNLTPVGSYSNAVARTPELLGTGLRVGAPAVTDGGTSWITNYMNAANAAGHRIDYVPVHYYRGYSNNDNPAGAANQLYNFLKTIHDATGKPIWVTEFNNGANWTSTPDPNVTQNRNVIEAMINMMDDTPWIERYAVYGAVEWFRDVHYSEGGLTPMGVMYRDHKAPLGHRQVLPDSGASSNASYAFEGNVRDEWQGNNALVYGTPAYVPGRNGQALSFDGSDDYLRLPYKIGDSGDFTFAAWIKFDGGGNWQRIFDIGNGQQHYCFLSPKSGGGNLRFAIRENYGTEQRLDGPVLPTGVWTHVAVTLSGDTGKLFVNGSVVATQTITLNPSATASHFNYLGKSQYNDPLFDGAMDDVRFLTTAMADADISALANATTLAVDTSPLPSAQVGLAYQGELGTRVPAAVKFVKAGGPGWLTVAPDGTLFGVPQPEDRGQGSLVVRVEGAGGSSTTATFSVSTGGPDLVARYGFNSSATPDVGNGAAALSGGTAWISGRQGTALNFNGTDAYATLPAYLPDANELTISTWVRWSGGGSWQRIFDFGSGTGQYLYLCPSAGGSNAIRFAIKNNSGEQQLNHSAALPIGSWQHLAVTVGNGTGRLYLNGNLVATNTGMSIKPSDLSFSANYLGKSQFDDPYFNGRIDEFQVFHRALTAGEIDSLFTGTAPAFTPAALALPTMAVGDTLDTTVSAAHSATLTYEKSSGPDWLTVEPDGRVSGIPSLADSGSNRFLIRALADGVLADELPLTVTVTGPATLVTHHQFDGNSADSAGSFGGTRYGSPGFTDGLYDQAVTLDGSDDYVQLPSGVANTASDATFTARFRWHGGGNWQRVFDFGDNTSQYCILTPRSAAGTMRFTITNTGTGSEQILDADPAPIGDWTHVAVTLAGNTGTLYVNGVAVDSRTITLTPNALAPTLNYFGKSQWPDPLFNGELDDFRLYRTALPATTIRDLATQPEPAVVPRSDFLAWMAGFSFPVGQDGPGDDPDGDGLATILEFLFGTDPLSGNDQAAITGEAVSIGEDRYLQLTARVRPERSGVALTAEGATTLGDLDLPGAEANAVYLGSTPDDDFELLRWRYPTPIATTPEAFMRLKATAE